MAKKPATLGRSGDKGQGERAAAIPWGLGPEGTLPAAMAGLGLGSGVQTSGTFQKQKMRDQHGLLTFQFYRLGHYKNKEKKEKRKLTFTTISQMQGYFDPLPFSRKDIMSK